MPEKSIFLPGSFVQSIEKATALGIRITEGATIAPDGLNISLDRIDEIIIQDLQSPTPPASPALIPAAEAPRIIRSVPLLPEQEAEHEAILTKFAQNWDAANGNRANEIMAIAQRDKDLRSFRLRVLTPLARADVIPGVTACYGGALDGAAPIIVDGTKRALQRLIHLTNPASPLELKLREYRLAFTEDGAIVQYRIPGVDDAEWLALDQPLQWPPDIDQLRAQTVLSSLKA